MTLDSSFFASSITDRLAEEERKTKRMKALGRKLVEAVLLADPGALPEAVRRAREEMVEEGKDDR